MKAAVLIIASAISLCVAACSASSGTGDPTPEPAATVTVTATVTPAAAATATRTVSAPIDQVTITTMRTVVRTRTVTVKPDPKGPVTSGYTYKVAADSGSAGTVTYTEGGSIEQATGVRLPWTKTVRSCGVLCEVSAQNGGSGKITCEIFNSAGRRVDKHSSTGTYAIASCQY